MKNLTHLHRDKRSALDKPRKPFRVVSRFLSGSKILIIDGKLREVGIFSRQCVTLAMKTQSNELRSFLRTLNFLSFNIDWRTSTECFRQK